MKQFQLVEIIWVDSVHTNGWRYLKDQTFGDEKQLMHTTTGYVLSDNKLTIVVCQSKKKHAFDDGDYSVDAFMEIPKVAILKIRKLK